MSDTEHCFVVPAVSPFRFAANPFIAVIKPTQDTRQTTPAATNAAVTQIFSCFAPVLSLSESLGRLCRS